MNVEPASTMPGVSIVVPARNEEANLGECLASLVKQDGVHFEIIVVDDGSTDRTRQIAEGFTGVRVISAPPLPQGWTGKNNAVVAGAAEAKGEWLLFTDADTVHLLGSLARAVEEAKKEQADLLSYSPEQIAVTFWEMAILPVVFAELARQYPPSKVSDPSSPIAAANGQYILVRHGAYEAVGGHRAIADNLLEDVALARAAKSSGKKIRFRYAADAVRTRMYRNFLQLREGWTKNLALLFPQPGWLAIRMFVMWALPWGMLMSPLLAGVGANLTGHSQSLFGLHTAITAISNALREQWLNPFVLFVLFLLGARLRRAHFEWRGEILAALFGYPMFAYLLLRSKSAHASGNVEWKGRKYSDATPRSTAKDPSTKQVLLRTEN